MILHCNICILLASIIKGEISTPVQSLQPENLINPPSKSSLPADSLPADSLPVSVQSFQPENSIQSINPPSISSLPVSPSLQEIQPVQFNQEPSPVHPIQQNDQQEKITDFYETHREGGLQGKVTPFDHPMNRPNQLQDACVHEFNLTKQAIAQLQAPAGLKTIINNLDLPFLEKAEKPPFGGLVMDIFQQKCTSKNFGDGETDFPKCLLKGVSGKIMGETLRATLK
eukprot:GHVP01053967.1.p1 GENE.GHVP01053967.1~~GHVP01053967.1.p1  ORF type:complete len:227 (+),score=35.98 GHVP01053967.1:722-1402(+)